MQDKKRKFDNLKIDMGGNVIDAKSNLGGITNKDIDDMIDIISKNISKNIGVSSSTLKGYPVTSGTSSGQPPISPIQPIYRGIPSGISMQGDYEECFYINNIDFLKLSKKIAEKWPHAKMSDVNIVFDYNAFSIKVSLKKGVS